MEEDKTPRERIKLKLNIYDIAIICIALAAVAVFYFLTSGGSAADIAAAQTTVRYTIELTEAEEGTSKLIEIGDVLRDNVKNYTIGSVAAVEFAQDTKLTENYVSGGMTDSPVPGSEHITIVITANATETERNITVGGGYVIRAGTEVSVTGPGYAGSGYITGVERSDSGK